jgi:hypothetical protein
MVCWSGKPSPRKHDQLPQLRWVRQIGSNAGSVRRRPSRESASVQGTLVLRRVPVGSGSRVPNSDGIGWCAPQTEPGKHGPLPPDRSSVRLRSAAREQTPRPIDPQPSLSLLNPLQKLSGAKRLLLPHRNAAAYAKRSRDFSLNPVAPSYRAQLTMLMVWRGAAQPQSCCFLVTITRHLVPNPAHRFIQSSRRFRMVPRSRRARHNDSSG